MIPEIEKTLSPVVEDDILELDEMWSFVQKKMNKRWIWIALCRRTRQVIAYHIGDRSDDSCRELWNKVPDDYKNCVSYSDFWESYNNVIDTGKHQCVGKESGETAHVEIWNNIPRQRLGRLTRKTLSFYKTDEYHKLVIKWFIIEYNLEKKSLTT